MAARAKTGPGALRGSREAKQKLAVVLEALAGLTGTKEAAERLGVSHGRYYQLEVRALQGMMEALEPRPRGRRRGEAERARALEAEKKALEGELRRCQALLRAATRAVGVKAPGRGADRKKKTRRRRGAPRAKTVLSTLRREEAAGGDDAAAGA